MEEKKSLFLSSVVFFCFLPSFSFSNYYDPEIFYGKDLLSTSLRCEFAQVCAEKTKNFCGLYGVFSIRVGEKSFEKLLDEHAAALEIAWNRGLFSLDKKKSILFLTGFKDGTIGMLRLMRKLDDLRKAFEKRRCVGQKKVKLLDALTKKFNETNLSVGWNVGDFLLSIPPENANLVHQRLNEYRALAEKKIEVLQEKKKRPIRKCRLMKKVLRPRKKILPKKVCAQGKKQIRHLPFLFPEQNKPMYLRIDQSE